MNTYTYQIQGMTCQGCVKAVQKALVGLPSVTNVQVSLEQKSAVLSAENRPNTSQIQAVLQPKYSLTAREVVHQVPSKLKQLKPLLLIFLFIGSASVLLHYKTWDFMAIMLDFMGLFFIVFSFFKLLDLKGFPASFAMYDPLAKLLPAYGWIYPFIELALGVAFLMRFELAWAVLLTVLVLGITTIGVLKTLLGKKKIQCACLGTALKLPMTEATLIENLVMLFMGAVLILKYKLL